jgi:hypothetical protein
VAGEVGSFALMGCGAWNTASNVRCCSCVAVSWCVELYDSSQLMCARRLQLKVLHMHVLWNSGAQSPCFRS